MIFFTWMFATDTTALLRWPRSVRLPMPPLVEPGRCSVAVPGRICMTTGSEAVSCTHHAGQAQQPDLVSTQRLLRTDSWNNICAQQLVNSAPLCRQA